MSTDYFAAVERGAYRAQLLLQRPLVTTAQLAEIHGVSQRTVQQFIRDAGMQPARINSHLFSRAQFDRAWKGRK